MSLLDDANRLEMAVRDDEQSRGFDTAFAALIARLAAAYERLEDAVDQLEDRKVDKPYER